MLIATNDSLRSVDHMVLVRLVHVWATSNMLLWCLITGMSCTCCAIARVLLSLHHAFWISEGSTIVIRVALWWVLMLSLWIVLVVMRASTTTSCHWLVYSIIWAFCRRCMTSLHVLGSWTWSIWATWYDTRVHSMCTMHFLLTSWSTMVSWAWVPYSWSSGFGVTSWRLSVTWTMNGLILMMTIGLLCWKLACFRVTIIIKSHRRVVWVSLISWIILRLCLVILIFRNQIVVTRRVSSTIQLLLISQLLFLRWMNWMMTCIRSSKRYRTNTSILILIIWSSWAKSTGTGVLSLISWAVIDFLSLNQMTAIIHALLNMTLIHWETSVVCMSCSCW